MKIKTSELTGAALDWAVAKCEKQVPSKTTGEPYLYEHRLYLQDFIPSANWTQCGPIIERDEIGVQRYFDRRHGGWHWRATKWNRARMADDHAYGPTPLVAAMRCYVASKLGDEVEIPDELIL